MATETENDTERVETVIGTTVVETPKRLYNPVTDRYERMENLSEDGYCRRFLAMLYAQTGGVNKINLNASPVATFDKEKWELDDSEISDDYYVLVKREADTKFDERVLGNHPDEDLESES